MKGLRNYINSIKPNFVGEGKYSKWFPLFDAVENFVFSTQTKTSNPVHVRDGVDIQKIMVIVWLSTFPAMFFGMYNLGAHSLEYLESINQFNTGDWHHYLVSFVGYDSSSFISKLWFGACYFMPIYITVFVVGIGWETLFAVVRKHEIILKRPPRQDSSHSARRTASPFRSGAYPSRMPVSPSSKPSIGKPLRNFPSDCRIGKSRACARSRTRSGCCQSKDRKSLCSRLPS